MNAIPPQIYLKDLYGNNPVPILIIEDSEADFQFTTEILRMTLSHPIVVDWAITYKQALDYLSQRKYAVCLVDYHLGDYVGTQVIEEARNSGITTPMIILTGQGDRSVDLEAMASGATDYLDKTTLKPMVLERAIRYAIRNARAAEQAREIAAHQERQRLARELHDSVSQTLFSANVIAETLPRLLDINIDTARDSLRQLADLTRGALAEMRTLLVELRPNVLIDTELQMLFQHLITGLKSQTNSVLDFQSVGNNFILPPEIQIAFYRIAQEALNNAIKHAHASRITLELIFHHEEVIMHIRDDGIGFDPNNIPPDHFGVKIINERARNAKINFSLDTSVGRGTSLTLIWKQEKP